jgi:hypothetical protein
MPAKTTEYMIVPEPEELQPIEATCLDDALLAEQRFRAQNIITQRFQRMRANGVAGPWRVVHAR